MRTKVCPASSAGRERACSNDSRRDAHSHAGTAARPRQRRWHAPVRLLAARMLVALLLPPAGLLADDLLAALQKTLALETRLPQAQAHASALRDESQPLPQVQREQGQALRPA